LFSPDLDTAGFVINGLCEVLAQNGREEIVSCHPFAPIAPGGRKSENRKPARI